LNENDVAQIARAMHAGADDFMMKPFDADHVRSKFEFVSTFLQPGEAAIPLRGNRQRFPESNSVRPILPSHLG
jgi:hypothetical protein